MIDWRAHRLWIGILCLALVIAAANAPLLGAAQEQETRKLAVLRQEYEKTAKALRQLQEDIAATEKLKTQIEDKEVEKSLSSTNRLEAARILERRAAESHLTHLVYTFSPEEKTAIDTPGSGTQTLATSRMTLTADAPTDVEIYLFFDSLRHSLPGRVTLRALSLHRIGAEDTPITASNLHLSAQAVWLSNGASPNLLEEAR